MLGVMANAALALREKYPRIKIAVSKFGKSHNDLFNRAEERGIDIFNGPLPALLMKSDLALITSGTATLEAALLGVPMVVAYRASPLSYAIYKKFVTIKHIGLPNIVAGGAIVPECVQNDVTEQKLFETLDKFISEPQYRAKTIEALTALRARLCERKPSEEVANIVCSHLT